MGAKKASHKVVESTKLDCLLFQVLVKGFGWEVFFSYLCEVFSDILKFTGLLLFRELIRHVEEKTLEPTWHVYFLSLAILVASWCQTIFYHQHLHLAMTSGMRMKTALMAAVYKKSLSINSRHQDQRDGGEVKHFSDCESVQKFMSYSSMVWSIPFQIFLASYLLWSTIDLPALSGVGLFLLLVFFSGLTEYLQQYMERKDESWKDKKLKNLPQTNAEELNVEYKIQMNAITELSIVKAARILTRTCAPCLVCSVTFATHCIVYPDVPLTAQKAFVTLAVLAYLQSTFEVFPEFVSGIMQVVAAVSRIESYLCGPELDQSLNNRLVTKDVAVRIHQGLFTWDSNEKFRLSGIDLDIPRGLLVAVVGPEGCGKTSLLSAILGEMECLQGQVQTAGKSAYVPQVPWIQNCCLRENILFGETLNEEKYLQIIDACTLEKDIENNFHNGDNTENAKMKMNNDSLQIQCEYISRDQQQKISVARALYSNADLYLFDDPLCDVSSHDAKHIFKHVFSSNGILKSKTRILATSEVQWLPLVDLIIYIQEGNILEMGSYMELMRKNENFAKFSLSKLTEEPELKSAIQEDEEVKEIKMKMREHRKLIANQSKDIKLEEYNHSVKQNGLERMECWSCSIPAKLKDTKKGHNHFSPFALAAKDQGMQGDDKLGNINHQVFQTCFKNVGSMRILINCILFALFQASSLLADVKLAQWTGDSEIQTGNLSAPEVHLKHQRYFTEYAVLSIAQVLIVLVCLGTIRRRSATSSNQTLMLNKNMESSDTSTKAQYKNLNIKESYEPDDKFPQIMLMWILCVFSVMVKLTVICIFVPKFIVAIVPLLFAYLAIQRFVVPASQELNRLEAASKLSIFSYFSETLNGCHVIRAFDAKNRFYQTFTKLIDHNNVFYFANITANRWLGVWIEAVSSLVVFFTAVFSLSTHEINASSFGFFVVCALQQRNKYNTSNAIKKDETKQDEGT
ncbi:multidrug resistance-associated protein 1-like [Physella acuta]|uniref:multidrug resistance-associated protein 1-like n=1 Tax=Physella acuta TaxID=109671 RepID=UPI0027DC5FDA|nr:multidrug resistance-associated protein 1-like [Physella acuta]